MLTHIQTTVSARIGSRLLVSEALDYYQYLYAVYADIVYVDIVFKGTQHNAEF